VIKPILFQLDPEFVHESALKIGELMGELNFAKSLTSKRLNYKHESLVQNILGINFNNPIGLAAGFDYDAKLTQILPNYGFGFETVGTVTNIPYKGNPKPRLGRLPKSQALMVNKGFRSKGSDFIINKLGQKNFDIPIGVSIGRSNSKRLETQEQSISDICEAFSKFEKSEVSNSYYELNISCPNLIHGNKKITFYEAPKLVQLLESLDRVEVKKPIFVKMPIVLPDEQVLELLEVIKKFGLKGVIFGNLETNRSNAQVDPDEAYKYEVGNISGKPTFKRSNELISLTYRNYKDKLLIIGCGGVFSGKDAYTKIKLGANLVQLITGMVFEGPTLISQINKEIVELLKEDGYDHISGAVGKNAGYKIA
jgi:dihydroorotate dehydrogenase subfamily 2